MNAMKTSFRPKAQQGVSMLEILIALLITTVGLLGFAGLQSRALMSTEDTYQRTQATSIAQEMIDRIRMNGITGETQSNAVGADASADLKAYTTATNWTGAIPTKDCFGTAASCSVSDMALYDIAQIRQMVEAPNTLPNGSALVAVCDSDGGSSDRLCAYVAWGSTTASDCEAKKDVGVSECVMVQGT